MQRFEVDERIENSVRAIFCCPRISQVHLRNTVRQIVEAQGGELGFTIAEYMEEVLTTLKMTSFREMASPGTGLPNRINQPKVNILIEDPLVLEIVHMTDIGISAMALERVRQNRERRSLINRGRPSQGLCKPADLEEYPWNRLKLVLSDGFMELQAIELDRLPFQLGKTPMGTKVRVVNFPIVGGVAYLRQENVTILGGSVLELQQAHRSRFYHELHRRMDEDEVEAEAEGLSVEGIYLAHNA